MRYDKVLTLIKSSLLPIFILISFSSYSFADEIPTRPGEFPKKEMMKQREHVIKMVVAEVSKTLPQTVDKYTQLIKIGSKNSSLVYTFEINTGAKNDQAVIKDDKARMQKSITKGICQSSKTFLDAGINVSYIYTSAKTKNTLFEFDITKKDCLNLIN
ncbi:hypothetical protein [Sulfurimonas sp. HSL-1716]|uniref:hypothetical protein n=1 Tax=Hydrocurvibacter sulfurireducens TaxID=3131937 RepID=UPI0031FA2A47